MSTPRLSVALFTRNQAPMLDAVLGHLAPLCAGLGVPIVVSDNASSDGTRAVCERHGSGGVRVRRNEREVSIDESVMGALSLSEAEYTWLCWDDSWLLPSGLQRVLDVLGKESPTALLAATVDPRESRTAWPTGTVDLGREIGPQIEGLVARAAGSGVERFSRADELFRRRFYGLPIPSIVYPTAAILGTDYRRYYGTFHPHIGAFYDVLEREQRGAGRIDVVELLDLCSVSLAPLGERGKPSWTAHFDDIAKRALPAWFELLPELYRLDVPAGLAYHRHLFRAAFGP